MGADAFRINKVWAVFGSGALQGLRSISWGFADQALISASNFLMMVLLARHLGPKGFGVFVLGYTVLTFANSVQSALFTQPHNVLGATRLGDRYSAYTAATFLSQLIFTLSGGAMILAVGGCVHLLGLNYWGLILTVGFATIAWQTQEYCRRVLYTQGDYFHAFANDLVTYGGQATGVIILWQLGRLTGPGAMVIIGIASCSGALVGIFRLRSHLFYQISRAGFRDVLTENWLFGKWLFGSAIAYWLSGQLYPLLTAGFVGVSGTGGLRATQNFVAPTHVVSKTFDAISPPRATRAFRDGGYPGLRRELIRFGFPLGGLLVVYFGLISVSSTYIVPWLLGDGYREFSWLIWIFSIVYILAYASQVLSVGLRSIGSTSPIFVANAASAIFTLTIGILLVRSWGLQGAAAGMIVHGLCLTVILSIFTLRAEREASYAVES